MSKSNQQQQADKRKTSSKVNDSKKSIVKASSASTVPQPAIPPTANSETSIGEDEAADEIAAEDIREEEELVFGGMQPNEESDSNQSRPVTPDSCSVSHNLTATSTSDSKKSTNEDELSLKVDPVKAYQRRFPDEKDDEHHSPKSNSDLCNSTKAKRIELPKTEDTNLQEISDKRDNACTRYCGLANLGWTCYSNSVLQMLFTWNKFREHILLHSTSGRLHHVLAKLFTSMITEASQMANSLAFAKIAPAEFNREFQKVRPDFKEAQQHDAHEYLTVLLECLHQEVNQIKKKSSREEIAEPKTAQQAWDYHVGHFDKSFLADQLMGQLETMVTCLTCGHSSRTWSCIWQLQLEIKSDAVKPVSGPADETTSKIMSVQDCVNKYTDDEVLKVDSAPLCTHCKQSQPTRKRQSIVRSPPILLVHLKRFAPDGSKMYHKVKVDFKLELTKPGQGSQQQQYHLMSSIMHDGSEKDGHYGVIYRESDDKWIGFEDEHVFDQVDNARASVGLDDMAYLCMYQATSEMAS